VEPPLALPDAPAWRRDRMEYEMDVETAALTPGESGVVLHAAEYNGGALDWLRSISSRRHRPRQVRHVPPPTRSRPRRSRIAACHRRGAGNSRMPE
jgi:hypothetical protein